MSYRTMQAVVDAWQRGCRLRADRRDWLLLLWLARNTDDKTLTVIRSQDRISQEIDLSERSQRTYLKFWRDLSVLQVIEHGGGRARKPARYRFDLDALRVYSMRSEERATAAAHGLPELEANSATRKSRTAGVAEPTPAVHTPPELGAVVATAGVVPELRQFGGGSDPYSGSPCTSASQICSSDKTLSEVRLPLDSNQPLARPLARSPQGRLAGASEGGSKVASINGAIFRALLEAGNTDEEISRMLRARGVTVDDVRLARAKAS